ncbi:phosphopentomutase [Haloimpatiens sp. FM7330]|uniref:phosphopentomutase n=1 Tax=Haloimpatiens sp. FM7330 TaxID=3298610 RepID=UPI0036455D5B
MGRFIVIVIDGLGVGAMDDVYTTRREDIGSNTFRHIVEENNYLKLNNLEKMGIMNVIDYETCVMKKSLNCTYGISALEYQGADSFLGHQEIVALNSSSKFKEAFNEHIDEIYKELKSKKYKVMYKGDKLKVLLVEDAIIIGDSIEGDLGKIYSVTGDLNRISYEQILKVGKIIRNKVKVPRVVVNGCLVNFEEMVNSIKEVNGKCVGINAAQCGVYKRGYKTMNLISNENCDNQICSILGKKQILVTLIGKAAEIINNPYGKSILAKDTEKVLKLTIEEMQKNQKIFILSNVQGTDLAGHLQDSKKYANELSIVDKHLGKIINVMDNEDILLVIGDHGNDPTIGHNKHTREYVPVLVFGKQIQKGFIGEFSTLSDIGITVLEYFKVENIDKNKSFLRKLIK